jgi:predicted small metal-binding protein
MANPDKPEQSRSGEKSGNPSQPKGVQSAPGASQHGSGHQSYHFRCADAGFHDCPWETKGATPDEVLHKAEQHGREQHRLGHIDEDTRNKVRSKIHRAA